MNLRRYKEVTFNISGVKLYTDEILDIRTSIINTLLELGELHGHVDILEPTITSDLLSDTNDDA